MADSAEIRQDVKDVLMQGRKQVISLKVTKTEHVQMKQAAKGCGLTVSEYLRRLHAAALQV